jgi:hypothetical protein
MQRRGPATSEVAKFQQAPDPRVIYRPDRLSTIKVNSKPRDGHEVPARRANPPIASVQRGHHCIWAGAKRNVRGGLIGLSSPSAPERFLSDSIIVLNTPLLN